MEKLINDFSYGLFFWQLILFVGLIFVLKKFAWKPILNAVNEREEGIKNALAEAENARKEMQNLTADNERILKEARNEREELLKDARSIREGMIETAKGEAQNEAEKMINKAKESIESEKLAAIADLKKQVAELSIGIAEKLMKDQLASKDAQVKLIDNMLKDVKLN
ncbi:MAG: F0F1 ATP synthase subunit B [Flavobacteriaceae bacterium]|nr:F0F1 ATP synthase subunit B [Flavobacteriaceae bacterium]